MTSSRNQPGFLGKALALAITGALLIIGFMFSLIVLAVAAVAALIALGYFWWKTRTLRKTMRTAAPDGPYRGEVIEGEAVVIVEEPGIRHRASLTNEPVGRR